jgi:hypothetical protein
MPFVPFYHFFPELAERETRSAFFPDYDDELPAGRYTLHEMYCDERACDCRRVFFMVMGEDHPRPLAYISYGWESADFYRQWMGFGDEEVFEELQGPALNPTSPQSRFAPALLEFTGDVLLADPAYVERLARHYRLVREAVDGPQGPARQWHLPHQLQPPPARDMAARRQKLREFQARKSQKKRRKPAR